MTARIKELFLKYREIIVYLIVGGMTTVVAWAAMFLWNWLFYRMPAHPTAAQNLVLSSVNWIAGVAFAYPTNRKWVFQSKNPEILKEASGFIASRLATLGLDIAVRQILGTLLGINVYVTTVISAVLVIIGNYIFSKLFVFRKKKGTK